MAQGDLGVIHTNSSYAPAFKPVNIINSAYSIDDLYNDAYNYLLKAELTFYRQFFPNVSTFDEFMAKVREIFQNAQKDREALLNCSNAALVDFLPDASMPIFNQNLQLIIIGDSITVDCNQNLPEVQIQGKIIINVTPANVGKLKAAFNNFYNRRGNRKYDINNLEATRSLKNKIRELYTLNLAQHPQKQTVNTTFNIKNVTSEKYNKDYITELLNDPSRKADLAKLRLQAHKSILEMKHFIFNTCLKDASDELRQAATETWNEIFPKSMIATDILFQNFWFNGKNYIKTLLGQGGEFFNETMIRYLEIKTNHVNPQLATIIGSIIKNGQQPHSDLEIITSLGGHVANFTNFQTKNINTHETIEINTNANLIRNNFGMELVSALVNYYSNTSTQGMYGDLEKQIESILEQRFFEAINLNVKPELDEFQTNTFYFVSGKNIVPGSELIQDIKNKNESSSRRMTFKISGKGVKYSSNDEDYKENFKKWYYWLYPKGSHGVGPADMIATKKNEVYFEKAASEISITTSYNFNSLLSSGRFDMFKAG